MSDAQWQFLGYDIRAGFRYIKAGWSDFFSSDSSPVASSLHEPVLVHESESERYVVLAGKKVAGDSAKYEAVLLSASISLIKHLSLPETVEGELNSFIELEVNAASPFPLAETLVGLKIIDRSQGQISLLMAISSKALVDQYLRSTSLGLLPDTTELWVKTESDEYVALHTDGYQERVERQVGRQKWLLAGGGYILGLLLFLLLLPVAAKFLEMREVRAFYHELEAAAAPVAAVKGDLASYNQMAAEINQINQEQVDPLEVLEMISALLPDDTYLLLVEYKNGVLRLDGRSSNAVMLLQQLDRSGEFLKVESIAGIRKEGRSGKERFTLMITPHSRKGE